MADTVDLVKLLRSRVGSEFDDEAHLSGDEAEQIIAALEVLVVERDEARREVAACQAVIGVQRQKLTEGAWPMAEAAEARALAAEAQRDKLRAELRDMHRRAQRAEGRVSAAQYTVNLWRVTLAKHPTGFLARHVVEAVDKCLNRSRARSTLNEIAP